MTNLEMFQQVGNDDIQSLRQAPTSVAGRHPGFDRSSAVVEARIAYFPSECRPAHPDVDGPGPPVDPVCALST